MAYRNGDGFNDPHWVLPSYTAQVLERRVDAQGPPWIYNTWEPFERGINHDTVMELIDAAGAMGLDIFTIDDGWQQDYGENTVNLTAFPGGLKPIQDAVEAHRHAAGTVDSDGGHRNHDRGLSRASRVGGARPGRKAQDHLYGGGRKGCDVHGQRLSRRPQPRASSTPSSASTWLM